MKIRKLLATAGLVAILAGTSIGISNAATKEDMDYLISETKKNGIVLKQPQWGYELRVLEDKEKAGNVEKNIFFSMYCFEGEKESTIVPRVFVTFDHITHDGDKRDYRQIVIGDGFPVSGGAMGDTPGELDGIPDDASDDRVFKIIHKETYVHPDGREEPIDIGETENMFTSMYSLKNPEERERISIIYDKAVELFKLKAKGGLTKGEQEKVRGLKSEIEEMVMKSGYLSKTREQLEAERQERIDSIPKEGQQPGDDEVIIDDSIHFLDRVHRVDT